MALPARAQDEKGAGQQFDWSQAEDELRDVLPAMFVGEGDAADSASAGIDEADAYDTERPALPLADVAGMAEVTASGGGVWRREPGDAAGVQQVLRGGLLPTGRRGAARVHRPRGGGRARSQFIAVSFADVVEMSIGQSERNIRELFEIARRNAPCVVFLDEVDAIGQKPRSCVTPRSAARSTSCCSSWTTCPAATRACSCWRPAITRGTWTTRCAGPAGSTGRC